MKNENFFVFSLKMCIYFVKVHLHFTFNLSFQPQLFHLIIYAKKKT